MADATFCDCGPAEDHPPAYGTAGWVLVEILGPSETCVYRYEIGSWAVDTEASTYWITEGVGIEYWLWMLANDLAPGWWVFERVVGTYVRGDGYATDDDEDWAFDFVRPALPIEIETLSAIDGDLT